MADKLNLGIGADEEPTIHTANTSESGFDGATEDTATAISYGEHAGGIVPSSHHNNSNSHNGTSQSQTISYGEYGGGIVPNSNSPGSSLHQVSLGKDTEGLVLFDLTTKPGGKVAFSPHCMKTILDLKLLGIGYDRQRLTFTQVRSELSSRVGENVTVPTLELANGSHLTDSWNIAHYLYEKHPKGSLLFPTPSSKSFARLVEAIGKFSLAPNLGPLTRVQISHHLDEDSKLYFENVKIGKAKMEKFRSLTNSEKEKYIEACIGALNPINEALLVSSEESNSRQAWLESDNHPTHADFVLYGWAVYSRVAGPKITSEIWNAHSAVAKWIRDMNEWASPDITSDFF